MKIHTVRIAEKAAYTDITTDGQCFHDVVLDELVSIGPVSKGRLNNDAHITLTYAREHAERILIVFRTPEFATEEREKLVAAWKELATQQNTPSQNERIHFVETGADRDMPLFTAIDLARLAYVGKPTPIDRLIHPSFDVDFGGGESITVLCAAWDSMVQEHDKLIKAWQAYKNANTTQPQENK